jgi:excisionase family DNA binding protein
MMNVNAIQNRALGMNTPGGMPAFPAGRAEGFITKEEVAARLKKTPRTVENWQRRGYIPFVKAGRSVLYKWSDVEAHLREKFGVCRHN